MRDLEEYRARRDFGVTPEPRPGAAAGGGDRLRFVVQKHDATRLHFDIRLEWDGVLLSWAVTKGPSADPAEKRLAVRTEDHPLDYATFEGTIPAKEYGGGTVMLWDEGWWEPLHDPDEGLRKGKLHVRLHGTRMKGGWTLVKMRPKGRETRENWLLIKERDAFAGRSADALVNRHRTSVASGRSMRAIAQGHDPAATSQGRKPSAAAKGRKAEAEAPRRDRPLPRFRKVQLATLDTAPPEGEGWQHEVKFDGYRCLVAVGKGGVRLYTRNGKDWSDRFGALCDPASALPCDQALIDGEVIAGGGGGDFSALQESLKSGGPLTFYAFDCLVLDGQDLAEAPLSDRRAALERLFAPLPPRGPLRLSPVVDGTGAEALEAMCRAGGEGIVSKHRDAPYRGARTRSWIKAKCVKRTELVIAGWSPSDKRGRPFSSLLLGSHEEGRLVYRGRVGTGFDAAAFDTLAEAMKGLGRDTPPFDGPLPAETRGARWLTPNLVAEIAYAEFTADGHVRHGVFRGLRQDKPAHQVAAAREAKMDQGDDTTVGGVRISNAGRRVYPGAGLTKGDVARHYDTVAARMLEHAAQRPLSLLRCPDGIKGACFFQKHAGKGFPRGIRSLPIEESSGATEEYLYVAAAEGLLGAVQMGTLEFHLWGSARDRIERPDRLVFDLDPDEGLDFDRVVAAARDVRAALAACGLDTAPMVTGGKGVHVIAPLRRVAGWDTVKAFAQTLAAVLAERHPDRYTATMSKAKRKGRVFIDWLRNQRGATAIAPYSLRARPGAAVATPVTWDELGDLPGADTFHPSDMAARLARPCPLGAVGPTGIGAGTVAALEDWAGS